MPKGRPPLEPRIKALEALCESLAGIIRFNEERIKRLEDAGVLVVSNDEPSALMQRIAVLEKQIAAMNDGFSHGNLPRPQYEQQFRVWPSANPITNGS